MKIGEIKKAPTEALLARLAQLDGLMASVLTEKCKILVELESREVSVSAHAKGLTKHYRAIASGKTSAEIVLLCAPVQFAIPALIKLAPERQLALAKGAPTKTVDFDQHGKIVEVRSTHSVTAALRILGRC